MAATSTGGGGLQENFALLDADMLARGYERHGDHVRGDLAQGGDRAIEVQLEGGVCYAILAVGDDAIGDLNLQLQDSRGRQVDQDVAPDARPTVRVCPQLGGTFTMHVQVARGTGAFIYASYRWPRGTEGPFGLRGVTWVRLSEATALLGVEGYNPDPGFTPENGRLRRRGAQQTHTVELTRGQCYAAIAVGGEGINDLDLAISHGGRQLATDFGSHNAFPSVRHCAETTGDYVINVTAAEGSGSYHLQIFSRGE